MNMEPEVIAKLQKQINDLTASLEEIKKSVTLLKLHDQSYIKSGDGIKPGIATKVAYDNNGMIIKASELDKSDIPNISIDQVDGLRSFISLTEGSKAELLAKINDIKTVKRDDKITETGCKVNIDSNGFVVSTAPLSVNDLPKIPISQVEGLEDKLDSISNTPVVVNEKEEPSVTTIPGTYTKVTIGSNGDVIRGTSLSVNDMPGEIITKINQLESIIPTLATRDTVDKISADVSELKFEPSDIESGTYTKVIVSSNGIVIGGSKLSINDLPEININNIPELSNILNDKANRNELMNLHDSVSSLLSMASTFTNLTAVRTQVEGKADKASVSKLENEITEIKKIINNFIDLSTLDSILLQINQLQSSIDNLDGRVAAIEFKLKQEEDFDKDEK